MSSSIHPRLKQDQNLLNKVVGRIYEQNSSGLGNSQRQRLISDIRKNRRLVYRKNLPRAFRTYQGSADYNLPIAGTDVQGYLARFVNMITNSVPTIDIVDENIDHDEKSRLENEFTQKFHRTIKGASVINKFFKNVLIDGIGGVLVQKERLYRSESEIRTLAEWMEDEKNRAKLKEQYDDIEIERFIDTDLVPLLMPKIVDITVVKPLALDDFIIPEDSIEDEMFRASFRTLRKWETMDDTRRKAKAGYYDESAVNELETKIGDSVGYEKTNYDIEQTRFIISGSDTGKITPSQNQHERWYSFVYYDINNDGFDELCDVVIDRKTKICLRFKMRTDVEVPLLINAFDTENKYILTAKSYVSYISAMHEGAVDLFNSGVDHARMQSGISGKYRTNSGWDPDEQLIGPNTWIPMRNLSDVEAWKLPEMSQSAIHIQQSLNAYRQSFSGLLDQTMPSASNVLKHRTYKGIATVIGQGLIIIQYRAALLKPKLDDMFSLIFKHTMNGRAVKLEVNANILNSVAEIKQQSVFQLFTTMMAIPQVAQNPAAVRYLAKLYWETFNIKGFDKVLPEASARNIPGVADVGNMMNPENMIRELSKRAQEQPAAAPAQ